MTRYYRNMPRGIAIAGLYIWAMAFTFALSARGEIIPSSRRLNWAPGIPGGIPHRTNIFSNVRTGIPGSTNVALGDGRHDDFAAINDAVNLCPSGMVVYLPAGRYRITQSLYFPYKDHFTLRGDGPGQTVICGDFTTPSYALRLGTSEGPPVPTNRTTAIMSGYGRGSSQITLVNTNGIGLSVGRFLLINQSNDNVMVTSISTSEGVPCTYADSRRNGTRNLQQVVRITGINGKQVTFDPPLYWSYNAALKPEATVLIYTVQGAGIESLTIENITNTSYCVYLSHADQCWMQDVETDRAWNYHIFMYFSVQSEIRDCRFHSSNQPEKSYGFEARFSTALLFENNIVDDVMAPFQLNSGSDGCVVGYNYITHIRNLDPTMGKVTMNGCHGAHPMFNLFEGNIAPRFQSDSYWGSCSHLTLFRNHFLGTDDDVTHNRIAISIDRNCWYHTVVGNVLGTDGLAWTYEKNSDSFPYTLNVIYRFGYPNMGNNVCNETNALWYDNHDPQVRATLLRHGNYDSATGAVVWDPSITDTNIPDSLYLAAKPGWWGNLRWPPIGPDINPKIGLIPAKKRYEAIMGEIVAPAPPGNVRVGIGF